MSLHGMLRDLLQCLVGGALLIAGSAALAFSAPFWMIGVLLAALLLVMIAAVIWAFLRFAAVSEIADIPPYATCGCDHPLCPVSHPPLPHSRRRDTTARPGRPPGRRGLIQALFSRPSNDQGVLPLRSTGALPSPLDNWRSPAVRPNHEDV